ncbi:MAG: DUF1003 domain-containing protein [Gemmatimonadaceae bacterium]|nr:DUF1003 domain-containing protein [Gemmatimonadaceae bacterium]
MNIPHLNLPSIRTTASLAIPELKPSFGERVADSVAAFGGSWRFIGLFGLVIVVWMLINARSAKPYDPYPFILLNLVLSCLAALQAPVIMMSQNRQAARDRSEAQRDHTINMIAEEQVLEVHRKLDEMRAIQIAELVTLQRRQMELLEAIRAVVPPDTNSRGT